MMKWNQIRYMFIAIIMFTLVMPTYSFAEEAQGETGVVYDETEVVQEVIHLINEHSIYESDLNRMIDAAIDGISYYGTDDPYISYYSPSEEVGVVGTKAYYSGNYTDAGFDFSYNDEGEIFVSYIYEQSVANGKLQVGDTIKKINDIDVTSEEVAVGEISVFSMIYDNVEGELVTVVVEREGKEVEVELIISSYYVPTVMGLMADSQTAYIKLHEFNDKTGTEFKEVLSNLQKQGMKSLILDLRDNSGGYVDQMQEVAKNLMKDKVIMYEVDNKGNMEAVKLDGGTDAEFPITVLTNYNTASASEILAAALQDHEIATIVGEQTYGKAAIQNGYDLSNGGVLYLTTHKYLTPDKHDIDNYGITPDIAASSEADQIIAALQHAGVSKVEVEFTSYLETKINGIPSYYTSHYVEQDNTFYVPSSLLLTLLSAEVEWLDEKNNLLKYVINDTVLSFSYDNGEVMYDEGDFETYIAVDAIAKKIDGFEWKKDKNFFTIQYEAK
ncbi:S41 family peptidase [Longirhabdus pacifica]|uniref:S41 family peptidase n=1 Tax=Longirhabdus pacifica TaxID=2305227 RepID=UPI001008FF15|nr:S41 family peptidase [Longirhabdus pacifica]